MIHQSLLLASVHREQRVGRILGLVKALLSFEMIGVPGYQNQNLA